MSRLGKRPKISGGNAAQRRRVRRYINRWRAAMAAMDGAFKTVFGKLDGTIPEYSVLVEAGTPGRPRERDYIFPIRLRR